MNKIIQELFEQYKVNNVKLLNYGFVLQNNIYTYTTLIVNNQMQLTLSVDMKGNIDTQVFDLESEEVYTLFLAEGASGVFVGEVKNDYQKVLIDIRENCFDKTVFTSEYALKIIDYIYNKYGDKPEFLWAKTPRNAVFRRYDNKKWYCAMLTTKAKSIGINSENIVELIDLRMPLNLPSQITDNKNFFPAYHMNKNNWITIKLDNCDIPIEIIFTFIDVSYDIAGKK